MSDYENEMLSIFAMIRPVIMIIIITTFRPRPIIYFCTPAACTSLRVPTEIGSI